MELLLIIYFDGWSPSGWLKMTIIIAPSKAKVCQTNNSFWKIMPALMFPAAGRGKESSEKGRSAGEGGVRKTVMTKMHLLLENC